MYDRERVQVCEGLEDRDDDVTRHILGDVEVSVLHEGPEVAAFAELLHHDVLLRVLKRVEQPHCVWVLAHAQNLDFASMLLVHELFVDELHAYFLFSFL